MPSTPKTTIHYDAMGREIERMNPPEIEGQPTRTHVSTIYRPFVRTMLDELTNEMTYVNDGLDRLVEVQEVNKQDTTGAPGNRYLTRYAFNPVDSLLAILDAQNNLKTFEYDGLQRKIEMNDPDRGIMIYEYDDASNLVRSEDAKQQVILYSYDGVNRLVEEDYQDEQLLGSLRIQDAPIDVIYS